MTTIAFNKDYGFIFICYVIKSISNFNKKCLTVETQSYLNKYEFSTINIQYISFEKEIYDNSSCFGFKEYE